MLLHRGSNAVSVLLKTDFRYSYVFVSKVDPRVSHTYSHTHTLAHSERSRPPYICPHPNTHTHTHQIHVVCDLHIKFYLIKHFKTRSEFEHRKKRKEKHLCVGLVATTQQKLIYARTQCRKGSLQRREECSGVVQNRKQKLTTLL